MKKRNRLLSVLMIMCMLISCATFSVSAASSGNVKFQATQNYSDAQKVLTLINKQRTKRGLSKLKLDKSLCKAASKRAAELAIYIPETSPHKRPNGKLTKTINGKIIYECCAEGYSSPKAVVKGWMSSPSHKKGILLSKAKSVGIGCVTTKNGDKYWTLEFSSKRASSVVKSKKKVTSTYKVTALSKYLKKSHFFLGVEGYEHGIDPEIEVGYTTKVLPFFGNNFEYHTQLRVSDYTWKSSNKSVATVDSKGNLTTKKEGTAVIYATMKKSPNYKLKITINVVEPEDDYDYDYDYIDDDDYYTYYE